MVNQVEIAPIPLAGVGFCHRPGGNYQPGEFRRLVNMELTEEGTLRKRPAVEYTVPEFKTSSLGRFIGNLQDNVIYYDKVSLTNDQQTFMRKGSNSTQSTIIWAGLNLYGGSFDTGTTYHEVCAFHRYNKSNHWISLSRKDNISTNRVYKIWLHTYSNAVKNASNYPTDFDVLPDVHTQLITDTLDWNSYLEDQFNFIKSFIFKDRLWIITSTGIFYSKTSDFKIFAAPDGGFLKSPDEFIKDAVVAQGKLWVLGHNDISVLSYNIDPTALGDGTFVSVAKGVGADALAAHEGNVYAIRRDDIFLVEANRVTQVFELNLGGGDAPVDYPTVQVVSFLDYLILNYRSSEFNFASFTRPIFGVAGATLGGTGNPIQNTWSTNTYFLNMKTGHLFEFLYRDNLEDTLANQGVPVEFYSMPFETTVAKDPDYWLFFHNASAGGQGKGLYCMRSSNPDIISGFDGLDFQWRGIGGSGIGHWASIPVLIEADSFTPDATELYVKKYRSLTLEGTIPEFHEAGNEVQFSFSFDDQAYTTPLTVISPLGFASNPNTRFPSPGRVPINQRARALSIKIEQPLFYDVSPDYSVDWDTRPQRFEIVRMGVFWTPTGRGPVNRTAG